LMWVFTPLWKAFIFHGRVHAKGTCLFERQAGERNFRYSCCILLQMCRRNSRWTTQSRNSSWSNTKGKTAVIMRLQKPSRWPSAHEQCTDGQLFGFGASRKILTSTTPKKFLRSSLGVPKGKAQGLVDRAVSRLQFLWKSSDFGRSDSGNLRVRAWSRFVFRWLRNDLAVALRRWFLEFGSREHDWLVVFYFP
jgi:hypothetical protein